MGAIKRRICIFFIILFGCSAIIAGGLLSRGENSAAFAATATNYALPEDIGDLFTDYTCTELADKDLSLEDIAKLKAAHGDAASQKYLNRAEQIITGNVRYSGLSEFTDANGKIVQAGNLDANSSRLNLRYYASDLIVTGVYGLTNEEIRVFVEAESDCLPDLIITQNHGFWNGGYRQKITLNKGMNVFTYSDFVSGSTHINRSEVKGGAIYLCNPYTHEQQGGVKVYIEGCGYYPVYKKGEDEGAFLGMLKEYEANRKKDAGGMLDMAELITDHTIITTTSSSLYETYITENAISPALNLALWGQFMTDLLEFNGIATSPQSPNDNWAEANEHLNINFRYMSVQPDSGAYTTSYHIGFYYEHAWFANFYANIDSQWIYNIAHEIGHQIDTGRRAIDETTNNMTATYAYVVLLGRSATSKWQPFDRGFNALSSDNGLGTDAFKDGHILYPQNDIRDRNYMLWWYLESVFPNFWADLNNMFREDPEKGLTDNEKMVYYSSLVTGVDLSEYYERWGFFKESQYNKFNRNSTSETFKKLMQSDKIKGAYSHFWLVDGAEYDYIRKNSNVGDKDKEYIGGAPAITSVQKTDEGRKIVLSNARCASHLGYEIYVTTDGDGYKIAGFTYSDSFVDTHEYGGATPTYRAIAVNRYFKTTDYGAPASEGQTSAPLYACRVGDKGFATLGEAMYAVTKTDEYKGKTVYLLADCRIDKYEFFPEVKIEVAPEINNDITVTGGSDYLFKSNYHFSMKGRENARIIIEGGSLNRAHGAFYLGSGDDLFEYVTFQNCKTADRGGAICQIFGNVTLKNCKFINCSSAKDNCALYFQTPTGAKSLKIYNCEFENDNTDIYFNAGNFNLVFDGGVPEVTLGFPQTEGATVGCENFLPSESDLARISFADPQYFAAVKDGGIQISARNFKLTFDDGGRLYQTSLKGAEFVFGSEKLEGFDDKKYIANYRDVETGRDYRAGDVLEVDGDKKFVITVKDKFALTLECMQGAATEYFAEGEGVYLPLLDGAGNKICGWTGDERYPAGGVYTKSRGQTLRADYVGYFRAEFWVNGSLQEYYYSRHGGQITTPACGEPDFKGWFAGGELTGANEAYSVERDIAFTAAIGDYIVDLSGARIEISGGDFTYTGRAIEPPVKVFINDEELSTGLYSVEYGGNIEAGRATVTIKPLAANVTGQKTETFIIAPRQLAEGDVQLSGIENFTYDGREKSAAPAVEWGGTTLKEGRDYDVTYTGDRVNAGTVGFTISFKGNFAGSVGGSFTIAKAQSPRAGQTTLYAESGAQTLADVPLPDNFEWVDGSTPITGNKLSARARYTGSDADNYETTEVLFEIEVESAPEPEPEPEPEPPAEDSGGGKDSGFNGAAVWLAALIPVIIIVGAAAAFIAFRNKKR